MPSGTTPAKPLAPKKGVRDNFQGKYPATSSAIGAEQVKCPEHEEKASETLFANEKLLPGKQRSGSVSDALQVNLTPSARFQEKVRDQRAVPVRTAPGPPRLSTIAPPISRPALTKCCPLSRCIAARRCDLTWRNSIGYKRRGLPVGTPCGGSGGSEYFGKISSAHAVFSMRIVTLNYTGEMDEKHRKNGNFGYGFARTCGLRERTHSLELRT